MAHELGGDASTGKVFVPGVQAVQQVNTYTFGGTWEATDLITVTINNRTMSFVAGNTTTATVVSTLADALNAVEASVNPEIARVTWEASTADLIATVDAYGVPLTITIATTETGGGAADAQTIDGGTSSTGVATVAATGPNFLNAAGNWIGGLPADGDSIVFDSRSPSALYGLDNSAVSLDGIRIDASFTGTIGLPLVNEYGSYESLERYMRFGATADGNTTNINIGLGEGNGSGRILINNNDARANLFVHKTARTPLDDHCVVWKSTHANSTVTVYDGSVGIAPTGRESATVATLKVLGGKVRSSNGVTLTTVNVTGGELRTETGMTTGLIRGGKWTHLNGAITTLRVFEPGHFVQMSDGTVGTLHCAGIYDADQSGQTHTVTTANLYAGFDVRNLLGNISTTGFILNGCGLHKGKLLMPENDTLS